MEQPNNKQKEASHISLRSILGGEILVHSFLRRQVYLLILIVILTILYIDNRYSSQQELIEIDRLKKKAGSHALKSIFRLREDNCKRQLPHPI